MTTPILQFIHVDFQWSHEMPPILNDFSWILNPGDAFCLDEPSGKGKSTFLKLCAGLQKPTHGKILRNTRKIGFAFQDQRLLPWLTPRENLAIAMRRPDNTRIQELLTRVGLADKAEQKTNTLSGGEAQRINLIRAIVNNPTLLLLDEPFNGLDDKNAEICSDLICEWMNMNQEHTMVFATHISHFQTLCHAKKKHL